jgi:hypothetical protein
MSDERAYSTFKATSTNALKRLGYDMGRLATWLVTMLTLIILLEKLGIYGALGYVDDAIKGPILLKEIYTEVFSENGASKVSKLSETTMGLETRVGRLESRDSVGFESDHLARYEAGLNGENLRVNKAYAKLIGVGKSDLMGFGWRNYVTKDFSSIYDSQWKEAYNQGRYFRTVVEFKNPYTGEKKLVLGEHYPMRDPVTTNLIGYQGVMMLDYEEKVAE